MRFYTKQHNYYCGIDLHTVISGLKTSQKHRFKTSQL